MTAKTTRARAGAHDLEVTAVRVPPDWRRVPTALVLVRVGAVTVTLTVTRRRNRTLDVCPPRAADGGWGVTMPAGLQRRVAALATEAAKADPEAGPLLTLAPWQRAGIGTTR